MHYVCPYCGEDRAEPFAHCGESEAHNVELNDEQYGHWLLGEGLADVLVNLYAIKVTQ